MSAASAPENPSAGGMLNVDYVVSGSVLRDDKRLTVAVELVETRTARIGWAEIFNYKPNDAFLVLEEIGNRIVASVSNEIETIERNRAILKPPNSLDAWEAHHRGLWHMYLFNKADNEQARHFLPRRCGSIRPLPVPAPACLSRTSRTLSRAGRSASRRSTGPTRLPPGA